MKRACIRAAVGAAFGIVAAGTAPAAALHVWPDADLKLGEQLIAQHDCNGCHVRKFGGDGSSIYRPKGRVSTPASLVTQVEACNTQLNLGMFPEEVRSVAAVLQRDHYKFPAAKR